MGRMIQLMAHHQHPNGAEPQVIRRNSNNQDQELADLEINQRIVRRIEAATNARNQVNLRNDNVNYDPFGNFGQDGANYRTLPILGEHSSRTVLQQAQVTDLHDETTVRGRKLILARQKQKDLKTVRAIKLFVALIFTASNQFALDDSQCKKNETCECAKDISIWYRTWTLLNTAIFLLVWSTECLLIGGNPSRKAAKHKMRFILFTFNPVLIAFMAIGIYMIMQFNSDENIDKKCLKSPAFVMQREISVITFFVCALEIIHLAKELNSACNKIKKKMCLFLNQIRQNANDQPLNQEILTSCDEDERMYERAWNQRNQQAEERRNRLAQQQEQLIHRRNQFIDLISQNGRRNSQSSQISQLKQFFETKALVKEFKCIKNEADRPEDYLEECSICIGKFEEGQKLVTLPCDTMHYFHHKCIMEWMQQKPECPLCRKDFKADIMQHQQVILDHNADELEQAYPGDFYETLSQLMIMAQNQRRARTLLDLRNQLHGDVPNDPNQVHQMRMESDSDSNANNDQQNTNQMNNQMNNQQQQQHQAEDAMYEQQLAMAMQESLNMHVAHQHQQQSDHQNNDDDASIESDDDQMGVNRPPHQLGQITRIVQVEDNPEGQNQFDIEQQPQPQPVANAQLESQTSQSQFSQLDEIAYGSEEVQEAVNYSDINARFSNRPVTSPSEQSQNMDEHPRNNTD